MGLFVDPAVNAVRALIAPLPLPSDCRFDLESTATKLGGAPKDSQSTV
jgi:hypothetical protein